MPNPYHHDRREMAGCPIWVGAFVLGGWALLRVGVAETYYVDGTPHLLVAALAIATAALALPLWRRGGTLAVVAVALLVYDLGTPHVPFGQIHRAMLLTAAALFLGGRVLYGYLGTGRELRHPRYRPIYAPSADPPPGRERETPVFLRRLGLSLPCSDADVRRAYRRLVREVHPDLGGDPAMFRELRDAFDRSRAYLAARSGRARPSRTARVD